MFAYVCFRLKFLINCRTKVLVNHIFCVFFYIQGYYDMRERILQRSTSQGSIGSPIYSRYNYTPTLLRSPQHFHRPGELWSNTTEVFWLVCLMSTKGYVLSDRFSSSSRFSFRKPIPNPQRAKAFELLTNLWPCFWLEALSRPAVGVLQGPAPLLSPWPLNIFTCQVLSESSGGRVSVTLCVNPSMLLSRSTFSHNTLSLYVCLSSPQCLCPE